MKHLKIYDNGGSTYDRITAIDTEPTARISRYIAGEGIHFYDKFCYVGASETGEGFYLHGEIDRKNIGKHLGKKVSLDSLTPELQLRFDFEFNHLNSCYEGREQLKAFVRLTTGEAFQFDVVTKGRDSNPDCKISSFGANLYFRTPKGMNSERYRTFNALKSEVLKSINRNVNNVESIDLFLSDQVAII